MSNTVDQPKRALNKYSKNRHPKHEVRYGTDLTASVATDSETLILDATTGERILHVAELDPDDDQARTVETPAYTPPDA